MKLRTRMVAEDTWVAEYENFCSFLWWNWTEWTSCFTDYEWYGGDLNQIPIKYSSEEKAKEALKEYCKQRQTKQTIEDQIKHSIKEYTDKELN